MKLYYEKKESCLTTLVVPLKTDFGYFNKAYAVERDKLQINRFCCSCLSSLCNSTGKTAATVNGTFALLFESEQ